MTSDGLQRLIEATSAKQLSPRNGHQSSYKGLCPCHDDSKPSLDIDLSGSGKVLVICRSCGAKGSDVIQAIGLEWKDFEQSSGTTFTHRHSQPSKGKVFPSANDAAKVLRKKYGKPSGKWIYHDGNGKPCGLVFRWDLSSGKQYRPVSRNCHGWYIGGMVSPRPLYRQSTLKDSSLVLVTEGEKSADVLVDLGFTATTSPHGSKSAKEADWTPLAGKEVVILPDFDKSGQDYATHVCQLLAKLNPLPQIKIVELPNLPPKGDAADFIASRMIDGLSHKDIRKEIERYIEQAPPIPLEPAKPPVNHGESGLRNYRVEIQEDADGKPKSVRIGLAADVITERLLAQTDGWPKACDRQLFHRSGDEVVFLDEPSKLFAFINRAIGQSGDCPIDWIQGGDKITKTEFLEYLRGHVEQFEAISAYPNWPTIPATFYTHDPLPEPNGKAIDEFVSMFSPATDEDGELIRAFILTAFWGGQAGKRPGFLIDVETGDPHGGRGVGKTTLVEKVAALIGGVIRISSQEKSEDLCKRLLSPLARNRRVVLLDNAKSLKLSSADLEGLVTADTISGRQLFHGEGRRPNHMLWCITINSASVSKDLAQRFVPILLKRCRKSAEWERQIDNLVRTKSAHIAADAIAILKQPGNKLSAYSRWAVWEDAILSKLRDPDDLQLLIADRQDAVDGDREEADAVRYEICEYLKANRISDPDHVCVFLPGKTILEVSQKVSQERRTVTAVTRYLKCLNISELSQCRHGVYGRGFVWRGSKTSGNEKICSIDDY